MPYFDRKTVIINFLKNDPGKEYTSYQIATYIFKNYPAEMERKIQTSNDKRLFRVRSKAQEKEIITKIYAHEFDKEFRADIQRIEPKIKITKRGRRARYCYVDSTDKIFDKFKVIKTLQNHKQQEFTAHEMAQLLLGTNSR